MNHEGGWGGTLLLAAAVLSLLVGGYFLLLRPVYRWDGVFYLALAAVFLLIALRIEHLTDWQLGWRMARLLRCFPLRSIAALGGAGLIGLAAVWARRRPPTGRFADLLWLWVLGVGWFVLAFAPGGRRRDSAPSAPSVGPSFPLSREEKPAARIGPFRRETLVLLSLSLVAFIVRVIALEHVPANLGGDEGTWGVEGLAMLEDGLANPFATRWFGFPSLSFLPWGLSARLFGRSVAGLRLPSALLGAAAVPMTYLLARELWGTRVAWMAGLILAFQSYHLHFSRLAVNNIADPLLITLALWLLIRGLRRRRAIDFVLCGLTIGLGWYGYFGARLIGPIAVLVLLGYVLRHRTRVPQLLRRLGFLILTALLVALPLLLYYLDHPEAFGSRANQVSIFASGWLEREQVVTGRSVASLLLQQVWKAISAFNHTRDSTFWYRPSRPLLDFVSGIFFVAGMVWAVARWRRAGNGVLLLWFWSALTLGWIFTENPPSSMRLVILTPALALLTALGLAWLLPLARRVYGGPRMAWQGVWIGLLLLVVALNVHHYFVVYTPSRVYGNPTAEVATVLARDLRERADERPVIFYGPPVIYWDFGTLRYMAAGIPGRHVMPDVTVEPIDPARGAHFVFLPHRSPALGAVKAAYPSGVETQVTSSTDGRLLYVAYDVPPR